MIPVVRLTPETLADFERHLSARGCYTPATVRNKVSLARALIAFLRTRHTAEVAA